MLTDDSRRLHNLLTQFRILDKVDAGIGITGQSVVQQLGQRRTIRVEVGTFPVFIDVFAHLGTTPAVIGITEYQEDIRTTHTRQTGDKRTVAIVLVIIARIANGCATIRLILLQQVATFLHNLPPPRLAHVIDVRITAIHWFEVPNGIPLRNVVLVGGIRVTQDADSQSLLGNSCQRQQQGK